MPCQPRGSDSCPPHSSLLSAPSCPARLCELINLSYSMVYAYMYVSCRRWSVVDGERAWAAQSGRGGGPGWGRRGSRARGRRCVLLALSAQPMASGERCCGCGVCGAGGLGLRRAGGPGWGSRARGYRRILLAPSSQSVACGERHCCCRVRGIGVGRLPGRRAGLGLIPAPLRLLAPSTLPMTPVSFAVAVVCGRGDWGCAAAGWVLQPVTY